MKLTEILVAGTAFGVLTGLAVDFVQSGDNYRNMPDCNKASDLYVIKRGGYIMEHSTSIWNNSSRIKKIQSKHRRASRSYKSRRTTLCS